MPYQQRWSATFPGCCILLIDQSGSMEELFGSSNPEVAGKMKQDIVANVVNNTLDRIGKESRSGSDVRPRVDIAVLGYGGATVRSALSGDHFQGKELISISELYPNPLRKDKRKSRVPNPDTGGMVEFEIDFPIWLEPSADGGTPMCEAIRKATALAMDWSSAHRESFPPMIINITDGKATDGDPRVPAKEFRELSTNDGQALFFNCQISDVQCEPTRYPGDGDPLPNDNFAKVLFDLSSELPDSMRDFAIQKGIKRTMKAGDKGFVFNADMSDLVDMITIASVPSGIQQTDPNK